VIELNEYQEKSADVILEWFKSGERSVDINLLIGTGSMRILLWVASKLVSLGETVVFMPCRTEICEQYRTAISKSELPNVEVESIFYAYKNAREPAKGTVVIIPEAQARRNIVFEKAVDGYVERGARIIFANITTVGDLPVIDSSKKTGTRG